MGKAGRRKLPKAKKASPTHLESLPNCPSPQPREDTEVKGKVISNDGESALVHFEDGNERVFYRNGADDPYFATEFAVGKTVTVGRMVFKLETREDLFDILTRQFPDNPDKNNYAIIKVQGKDNKILIGQGLTFYGVIVFCAPVCEAPDGSDDKVFALMFPDGETEWLDFCTEAVEYASSRLTDVCNNSVAVGPAINNLVK